MNIRNVFLVVAVLVVPVVLAPVAGNGLPHAGTPAVPDAAPSALSVPMILAASNSCMTACQRKRQSCVAVCVGTRQGGASTSNDACGGGCNKAFKSCKAKC